MFREELSSKAHDRTKRATAQTNNNHLLHELLRNSVTHLALYDYIRDHPDCTRQDACAFVICNWRRITDLIDEGLVYVSGKRGQVGLLRVVDGGSTGRRRDLLKIQIQVFVNEFGEYSCDAKLIGQQPGATEGNRIIAAKKIIPIRVPRPQENYRQRVIIDADESKILDLDPIEVTIWSSNI